MRLRNRIIITLGLALAMFTCFWLYNNKTQPFNLDDLIEIKGNDIITKYKITILLPNMPIPIPKGYTIATVEE